MITCGLCGEPTTQFGKCDCSENLFDRNLYNTICTENIIIKDEKSKKDQTL